MASAKTKTIGLNMPVAEASEIERRAANMGVSTSLYIKTILRNWIKTGKKLELTEG